MQSVEGRSMDCFPRARPLVSHHVKKMSFYETLDVRYLVHKGPTRDWDSVVGIMSHYGLGIDCRSGEIFRIRPGRSWFHNPPSCKMGTRSISRR